ncbi:MAG: hypothetical protein PVG70_04465 [Desulfobacterales bacterium]
MLSGIQEILVLVIIMLAIFFVPRMLNRREESTPETPAIAISGKKRLAIVASILWPALMAVYFQPWKNNLVMFLYVGPGPVLFIWLVYWVFVGFRRGER